VNVGDGVGGYAQLTPPVEYLMKPRKILVATDFSAGGDLAVQYAAALARRFRAELLLLHALPPPRWLESLVGSRPQWLQAVRGKASVALKVQADQIATDNSVDVSTGLVTGKASAAISAAAIDFGSDLVVAGVRGEGARTSMHAGLGQTASKLVGATTIPVLLIRRHDPLLPDRVLAAVDLTSVSRSVLSWASVLAGKGDLTVMHVFDAPFASRMRRYGVSRKTIDVYASDQQAEREKALRGILLEAEIDRRVSKLVLRGEAVRSITTQVRKLKINTVVVGKHGRRKRDAAAPYGSVCSYIANSTPANILIVP
jgi:universal stress protein E